MITAKETSENDNKIIVKGCQPFIEPHCNSALITESPLTGECEFESKFGNEMLRSTFSNPVENIYIKLHLLSKRVEGFKYLDHYLHFTYKVFGTQANELILKKIDIKKEGSKLKKKYIILN